MNIFQFGHSLLTGEWKLQRQLVQEHAQLNAKTRSLREHLEVNRAHDERYYAGAQIGINRPAPNQLSTPEDYRQANERIVLIRAARQLEEDGGFFDGLLDDFETYVIGDELKFMPNTGNPDADAVIREFLEWKFDEADFSKRLDLTKIAQVAIRSMKRDGECGFIPVYVDGTVKLRYYSGDCIGNPTIGANTTAGDYNGIRVNPETDTPEFFDLFRRTNKMNFYVPDRTVSANHFWHYYDPFRFQQFHGVSAFKTAIRDGFDIDQILEYTKMNIKWRSSQLPTVHTDTGRPKGPGVGYGNRGTPGAPPVNGSGMPYPMQVNVDGVTTTYMNIDEKVVDFPNDFPNTQLQVSIEEFRRQCCKGSKLPYEFVYRADNGGVVQRFWVDKARNTFAKDKHLARRTFLNPFKNRLIQCGIDSGELDLSSFGNLSDDLKRFAGQWQMGRDVSVDYGRETDADLKLIEAGLMSPQDKTSALGGSPAEVRREIRAHAVAIMEDAEFVAKKTGQTVETVLPFITKKFPNPVMNQGGGGGGIAAAVPTGEEQKDKALIESIGVGGSQALSGILQQVASGAIPRESGINSLVIIFGMTPENAAKLIPEQGSAKPVPGAAELPDPEQLKAPITSNRKTARKNNG